MGELLGGGPKGMLASPSQIIWGACPPPPPVSSYAYNLGRQNLRANMSFSLNREMLATQLLSVLR